MNDNNIQLEKQIKEKLATLEFLEKERESYDTVIYSLTRKLQIETAIKEINEEILILQREVLTDKSIERKQGQE